MRVFALLFALLFALPASGQIFRDGTSHHMEYGATALAITSNLGAQTDYIRIVTTTAAYFAIATSDAAQTASATATTSSYIPANSPLTVKVSPNSYVVVIQVSTGGTLHVTELSQ